MSSGASSSASSLTKGLEKTVIGQKRREKKGKKRKKKTAHRAQKRRIASTGSACDTRARKFRNSGMAHAGCGDAWGRHRAWRCAWTSHARVGHAMGRVWMSHGHACMDIETVTIKPGPRKNLIMGFSCAGCIPMARTAPNSGSRPGGGWAMHGRVVRGRVMHGPGPKRGGGDCGRGWTRGSAHGRR